MKKILSLILAAFMIAALAVPAFAEEAVIPIKKYEDLLAISQNPSGSYRLENDIDCAGKKWTPVEFHGNFDGNGFALMNLSVGEVGGSVRTTIDGNWKNYDTYFSGLFSVAEGAHIKNLTVLGVNIDVTHDDNTYIGAIAGYIGDSTIENCKVEGFLKLTSSCKSFGVGGIAGYGFGKIDSCTADVTLVSIDTDKEWKDEQFMGGVYANGYPDVTNCNITIKGYNSDHGYVHDGGIGGMYILPKGLKHSGHIDNNTVNGFINFFEDNRNRRAYCVGEIGEIMSWVITKNGNDIKGFERRETKDYSKNLLPNMCENPEYETTVTEPSSQSYGYTVYKCKTCDYSYKADYKSLNVYVEPEKKVATSKEKPKSDEKKKTDKKSLILFWITAAVVVTGIITGIVILTKKNRNNKKNNNGKINKKTNKKNRKINDNSDKKAPLNRPVKNKEGDEYIPKRGRK